MSSERYERVMAAVHRRVPDRVPWGLWGHVPALPFLRYYSWEKSTRDGEELAKAHIALLNALDYRMDLLKVTCFYRFMAVQWGTRYRFVNNEESPERVDVAVKETWDWKRLFVLDPRKELREYVRAVSILAREIGEATPFIVTIPSPLVQALHHLSTPDRACADMKSNPDAINQGLETIAETCIEYGKACIGEGATGIFYGVGNSTGQFWSKMDRKQLEEFGLHYDKKVLGALQHAPIRILHICSKKNDENPQRDGGLMEEGWFRQYPVNAINWWSASFTSLSAAKRIYGDKFCIVGGVDHDPTMRSRTPRQVEEQVSASIEEAARGGGFIIGPGCTLFQDTPLANFNAVGRAMEKHGKY